MRINYGGDDTIVQGLRRRDPEAMEALYDKLSGQGFGLAYRILGEARAAEDVVQEAFLAVWRQADLLDPRRGGLASLVMTIIHHKAIDLLRAKRGNVSSLDSVHSWNLEALDHDVSEEVLKELDKQTVLGALNALPQEQREAIMMAYFDGLTHTEIAKALKLPLGTVKGRLRLGLERMRAALGARESRGV